MFLQQLKASSRNSVVVDATAATDVVDAAVIAAARSVIPNGRNASCKSAVSPKPSREAKR